MFNFTDIRLDLIHKIGKKFLVRGDNINRHSIKQPPQESGGYIKQQCSNGIG